MQIRREGVKCNTKEGKERNNEMIAYPIFQSLLARAAAPMSGKNTRMVPALSSPPLIPVVIAGVAPTGEGNPSAAAISAISAISAASSAASSGSISSAVDTGAGTGAGVTDVEVDEDTGTDPSPGPSLSNLST